MMGVFQLGEVFTVLLSEMVISGFTTGVAFHVLTSQAKNLLGIAVPRYSGPFKAFYVSAADTLTFDSTSNGGRLGKEAGGARRAAVRGD